MGWVGPRPINNRNTNAMEKVMRLTGKKGIECDIDE